MKKNIIYGIVVIGIVVGGLWSFNTSSQNSQTAETKIKPENTELLSYETDADSADQCTSYEKYDDEAKVCYFECANETECSQIESNIDQELNSWDKQAQDDTTPLNEKSDEQENILAKYDVTTNEKITFNNGSDLQEYRKLWKDVAALSPDQISDKYIISFEIYSDPQSDTIAYVNQIENTNKWRMVVNVGAYKTMSLREQKMTLIHELGHIISLNTTQVDPNQTTCPRLQLDEGCALQKSYIETFWEKFWKGLSSKTPTYDANKYVDEYATTNETEDWAETFAFFVIGNQENNNSVKVQKIQMFYTFPDLVAFRTDMRNVIGRDIIRARKN